MKLAIASDLSGFPLKKHVLNHLLENHKEHEILDFGIMSEENPQPFYEQAEKVAMIIQKGKADGGILICGTGQGMCIAANKYKGVYAGLVTDIISAERAKSINNANIITMGCWVTAPMTAVLIVDKWLSTGFTQGMEHKNEFIKEAFIKINEIEMNQFK